MVPKMLLEGGVATPWKWVAACLCVAGVTGGSTALASPSVGVSAGVAAPLAADSASPAVAPTVGAVVGWTLPTDAVTLRPELTAGTVISTMAVPWGVGGAVLFGGDWKVGPVAHVGTSLRSAPSALAVYGGVTVETEPKDALWLGARVGVRQLQPIMMKCGNCAQYSPTWVGLDLVAGWRGGQ